MSICLSHTSAVAVLRQMAARGELLEHAASAVATVFEPDIALARSALSDYASTTDAPELLVCEPKHQRSQKDAAVHLWTGKLPEGSFYRLENGIYVASAEFTLLQQAGELQPVRLCQLLGRFLGTYKTKEQVGGLVRRIVEPALTTEESVLTYLTAAKRAKGV